MVNRSVWDRDQAGSIPVTPTSVDIESQGSVDSQ